MSPRAARLDPRSKLARELLGFLFDAWSERREANIAYDAGQARFIVSYGRPIEELAMARSPTLGLALSRAHARMTADAATAQEPRLPTDPARMDALGGRVASLLRAGAAHETNVSIGIQITSDPDEVFRADITDADSDEMFAGADLEGLIDLVLERFCSMPEEHTDESVEG